MSFFSKPDESENIWLRGMVKELTSQLIAMKHEGFAPVLPQDPQPDAGIDLPEAVEEALGSVTQYGSEGHRELATWAHSQIAAGQDPEALVDRIIKGASYEEVMG